MAAYSLEYREHLDKVFRKLGKKDKRQLVAVRNKIVEILDDPYRFKPLNAPMHGLRRVHIMKSFVLTYSVEESTHTVWIEDYSHHDDVYE